MFGGLLLACACYAALAAWFFRSLAADPANTLAVPFTPDGRTEQQIGLLDLALVAATVARTARVLVSEPWNFFGGPLCFPFPNAHTLGEHMFGVGLLAAPWYAATREPIVAFNMAVVLTVIIPAVTAFLLAYEFTRSAPAAFLCGLLFGFLPVRIGDPTHPYRHGDLWLPLVVLFWWRLAKGGRWRDAVGLAVSLSLQMLESFYSVLECALFGAVWGSWVAWEYRRNLARLLPKVAMVVGVVALVGWLVFEPYVATRSVWSALVDRGSYLNPPSAIVFGGMFYPGSVAVALALVGLADRFLRRGQNEPDPRLAIAGSGLVTFAFSLAPVSIESLGFTIPAPLLLVRNLIPGIDSVRVPLVIAQGASLSAAVLAAYGLVAVQRAGPRVVGIAVVVVACAFTIAERAHPFLVAKTFSRSTSLTAVHLGPGREAIELASRAVTGPTLDLPVPGKRLGALRSMTEQILLTAFHGQPTSTCYNSFQIPMVKQVQSLASRLPEEGAVAALASLGFTNVQTFSKYMRQPEKERMRTTSIEQSQLERVEEVDELTVYRLRSSHGYESDWTVLADGKGEDDCGIKVERAVRSQKGTVYLPICVQNTGSRGFLHPEPVVPTELAIEWRMHEAAGNGSSIHTLGRGLLPVALPPGGSLAVDVEADAPSGDGLFDVIVRRASDPSAVVGRKVVEVASK